MARSGGIIADRFRGIPADKEGAGIGHVFRIAFGIFRLHGCVLRCDEVEQIHRFGAVFCKDCPVIVGQTLFDDLTSRGFFGEPDSKLSDFFQLVPVQ